MFGKRTVLIVDDNIINRKLLYKILSDKYFIIEAENGVDALEKLKTEKNISAILLDIVMPIMDGYEFLATIKDNEKLNHIPIIVMTKKDAEEDEVKSLELGASDFLVKPYKPLIIKHTLANLIRLHETTAIITAVERDSLTNLYNKEFFKQKAEDMIRGYKDTTYVLVYFDIENFKLVNDLYGLKMGNKFLVHFAEYFKNKFEDDFGDKAILGRIEGDKFGAIMPYTHDREQDYFKKIVTEVNNFEININLIVRFGIYIIKDLELDFSAMMDRAIIAHNESKRQYDKYFAYYNDEMRQKLINEQVILNDMSQSLIDGDFIPYFQPKYNLKTEKIVGAEVLVRWIHPTRGFMAPNEFIPIFEKNGFITSLDRYMYIQTCKKLREWIDKGYNVVPISVNLSRADLYSNEFMAALIDTAKEYNIPIKYLHLEITETLYTEDSKQIIAMVEKLKKEGFLIEMDDFGSGYSSLNMITDFPIDILKMDMKFLDKNEVIKERNNIIAFVISLAKLLKLEIIAEGVETFKQADMLRDMGCDIAQGYYYDKPLKEEEFITRINTKPQRRHGTDCVTK